MNSRPSGTASANSHLRNAALVNPSFPAISLSESIFYNSFKLRIKASFLLTFEIFCYIQALLTDPSKS